MGIENEMFVGDGLYVSWDGEQFCLRAPREEGDHLVFFDYLVLKNILDYVETIRAVRRSAGTDHDEKVDPGHS